MEQIGPAFGMQIWPAEPYLIELPWEKRVVAALTRRVILEDSPGAWGMSSAHNIFPLNEGDGTSLGEIITQSWTAQRNK